MNKPVIHLICNAHLDPVWLWEWEEGAAEAISTFRVAADFCEDFDGFIFNHNEAVLYQWVEEYEPELFARIQRLVAEGKWHIMGGWYLQPDCNMPSGESFVRQILLGRSYFQQKFGVSPRTAINFDSFGHSRGLVQILARSGYTSYIVSRPMPGHMKLEQDTFHWVGFDGSSVMVHRAYGLYNSGHGKACKKVRDYLEQRDHKEAPGCVLWGIGNHGGGPSRLDLSMLRELKEELAEVELRDSTPEAYFDEMAETQSLPVRARDMNAWAVGCYTSQIRLKQLHRKLESELYVTEKMATAAWVAGLCAYPEEEMREVSRNLAFAQFHDILPGSSIQPVEETSMRLMHHGLERLSRIKARTFFALAKGQAKAAEGEIPILVYNPHPVAIETDLCCEFQLGDQNWQDTFTDIVVHQDGKALPTQVEKEASNLTLDWRKKVVWRAKLEPGVMNRFDCRLMTKPAKPVPDALNQHEAFVFDNGELRVVINPQTGLMDGYEVQGVSLLKPGAFKALVIEDSEDSWGMKVSAFRQVVTEFEVLDEQLSAAHAGIRAETLLPVRMVEDGAVRTVIEVGFRARNSWLLLTYFLPKKGTEVRVDVRVNWNEKDKMLKLAIPTALTAGGYQGQTAFGIQELPVDGNEAVAQQWVTAVDRKAGQAVTVINNGTYGSDFKDGEIRLSLVRSPAFSGHPIDERVVVPQNRFTNRIDQGERSYSFYLNGGEMEQVLDGVPQRAQVLHEQPMALSFFPPGGGQKPDAFITVNGAVQLVACKKADLEEAVVVRLFEPNGKAASATVHCQGANRDLEVEMKAFEVRTFLLMDGAWKETDLMENGG